MGEGFEEVVAGGFGNAGEDGGLEFEGDFAQFGELGLAGGFEADAVGAAVAFVGFAAEPAGGFHAFEEGGDGVGIAAHQVGEFALGDALGVALREGAENGELVGGGTLEGDAPAEGLIKTVPRAAQENGKAAGFGPGRRGGGGFGHDAGETNDTCRYYFGCKPG